MSDPALTSPPSPTPRNPRRVAWIFLGWVAAFAAAFAVDAPVATALNNTEFAAGLRPTWWATAMKIPGEFWFVVLCAIVASIAHRDRWRAGVFILLAAVVSGVNGLVKWVAGRTRPFKLMDVFDANGDLAAAPFALQPFRGGVGRMFDSQNLSFPSGHAALAFAVATALAALFPRWRWAFYGLAAICAAERVLENAHWVSDVLAAAALGVGGVTLLRRVVTGLEERARARRDPARPSVPVDGTASSSSSAGAGA